MRGTMGERVTFPSNSHTCNGYLAGKGPAIVVIQEWWGLVPHIENLVDRFAAEGFLAIAPDLFHGQTTKSPDEAGKMLMELDADRAERELAGAGQYLLGRPECTSKTYGVIGVCMGGALAQYVATKEAKVGAAVSFYGGFKEMPLDFKNLHAPLMLIYGENDQGVPAESGRQRERELKALGKDMTLLVYPGAGHAFFNDARPEAYNEAAAKDVWPRVLDFFRKHVQ